MEKRLTKESYMDKFSKDILERTLFLTNLMNRNEIEEVLTTLNKKILGTLYAPIFIDNILQDEILILQKNLANVKDKQNQDNNLFDVWLGDRLCVQNGDINKTLDCIVNIIDIQTTKALTS